MRFTTSTEYEQTHIVGKGKGKCLNIFWQRSFYFQFRLKYVSKLFMYFNLANSCIVASFCMNTWVNMFIQTATSVSSASRHLFTYIPKFLPDPFFIVRINCLRQLTALFWEQLDLISYFVINHLFTTKTRRRMRHVKRNPTFSRFSNNCIII